MICRNLWSRPWRGILTPITLKTCSGYLWEYPCSLLTWIWTDSYLPILVLFHWYIIGMYISCNDPKRCTKETFLKGSAVYVNLFSVLRSTPPGTIDINLRSCVLNRHKLRQSQIATVPSQFVICHNLWSKPWRRKLSPSTLKTCSGYLGEYSGSLLTWIWKLTFLPILELFHWYICLCVCISVIKPIIDVQRKPSW